MAEYCLSYMLKEAQYHEILEEQQRNKQWSIVTPKPLKEVTVTLFGTGKLVRK